MGQRTKRFCKYPYTRYKDRVGELGTERAIEVARSRLTPREPPTRVSERGTRSHIPNMKNLLISAALVSASVFATSSFAATAVDACTTEASPSAPVPVSVVSPTDLPRTFRPTTVQVTLTIDEKGVPHNVKPVGFVDRDVAKRVIAAVSQWRFTPKQVNGQAVAGRFVLPLEIVEGA